MELTNEILENAIAEINEIHFEHHSDWLEKLKASAIDAVRSKFETIDLADDYDGCNMQPDEYEKFKAAVADEAKFHDEWDLIDLEHRIVRSSTEYVIVWNNIGNIMLKYDETGSWNQHNWFEDPISADTLIDEFCHYDLPKAATVGGSWDLPDCFVSGVDDPNAPTWPFMFAEFTGYIKSVSTTEQPGRLEIEYWIYRRDSAHCDGYYSRWSTGKAIVDTGTHRRWMIEMKLSNSMMEKIIAEINEVKFSHHSNWFDRLKTSAIDAVKSNFKMVDIADDYDDCTMPPDEYTKFRSAVADEAKWHDEQDVIELEHRIVRHSREYVDAWNTIGDILMKYDEKGWWYRYNWFEEPISADALIDEFCHYDLPEDEGATVGKFWDLPDHFIVPNAPTTPYWDFSYDGFTAYIKSITPTDNPDQVEVEYCTYRLDETHGEFYYSLWNTAKAIVNTKTHRRWSVE